MRQDEPRNHLDASDLLFEVGRQLQAVALVMRKHEIAPHQVCECGRVAVRMLPVFGLRCEIACHQRDLAYALMWRLMAQMAEWGGGSNIDRRPVGRAAVRPARQVPP